MATIDHQALARTHSSEVQASTNAYGFDPSWFARNQLAQTSEGELEQMKRDYLAQNLALATGRQGSKTRLPACGQTRLAVW